MSSHETGTGQRKLYRRLRREVSSRNRNLRLLNWDDTTRRWRIDAGRHDVFAGSDAATAAVRALVVLRPALLKHKS